MATTPAEFVAALSTAYLFIKLPPHELLRECKNQIEVRNSPDYYRNHEYGPLGITFFDNLQKLLKTNSVANYVENIANQLRHLLQTGYLVHQEYEQLDIDQKLLIQRAASDFGIDPKIKSGLTLAEIDWTVFDKQFYAFFGSSEFPKRSFGVELEVLDTDHNYRKVRDIFQRIDLPYLDQTLDTGANLATFISRPKYWVVKREYHEQEGKKPQKQFIEITAPILSGINGIHELYYVFSQIENAELEVNETCGFHVHAGKEGIPLQGLKRIFSKYLAGEDHIDKMVLPHRRGFANRYYRPLYLIAADSHDEVIACSKDESLKGKLIREALEMISASKDEAELLRLFRKDGGDGTAYAFKLSSASFGTLENRHSQTITDASIAVNWTARCIDFIESHGRLQTPKLGFDAPKAMRAVIR